MKEARTQRGLSQEQLGLLVGTTQQTIGAIESGASKQSKLVPAICEVLAIPLPFEQSGDALEEEWVKLGRKLRFLSETAFARQLASLKEFLTLVKK